MCGCGACLHQKQGQQGKQAHRGGDCDAQCSQNNRNSILCLQQTTLPGICNLQQSTAHTLCHRQQLTQKGQLLHFAQSSNDVVAPVDLARGISDNDKWSQKGTKCASG